MTHLGAALSQDHMRVWLLLQNHFLEKQKADGENVPSEYKYA